MDNLVLFLLFLLWAEILSHVRREKIHYCLSEFSDFRVPNLEEYVFPRVRQERVAVEFLEVPLGFDFINEAFLVRVNYYFVTAFEFRKEFLWKVFQKELYFKVVNFK